MSTRLPDHLTVKRSTANVMIQYLQEQSPTCLAAVAVRQGESKIIIRPSTCKDLLGMHPQPSSLEVKFKPAVIIRWIARLAR